MGNLLSGSQVPTLLRPKLSLETQTGFVALYPALESLCTGLPVRYGGVDCKPTWAKTCEDRPIYATQWGIIGLRFNCI
jgi:hypothetical protein